MNQQTTDERNDCIATEKTHPLAQKKANATPRGRAQQNRKNWRASTILALLLALIPLGLAAANPFSDLTGGPHDGNIDAIYSAGITTGCVPNAQYCPTSNVTREEMASFLARLGGLGANPPVANAKTAQTAARLDGTPAAAYAQKAQFKGTKVLDVTGQLPKSATIATKGGTLIVFVSGSAYRANAGPLEINLDITGPVSVNDAATLQVYTNEGLSHKAFPSGMEVIENLPADNYTFTLKTGSASTLTDPTDYFTISVIEIPKP